MGTTGLAVQFILQYLGSFTGGTFSFKRCEYLPGENIHLESNSKIVSCINKGGVALIRVCTGKTANAPFHYMLALGIDSSDSDWLLFFDPYYRTKQFTGNDAKYLKWLNDGNKQGANLMIKRERLDSYEFEKYSMSDMDERECCLLERL